MSIAPLPGAAPDVRFVNASGEMSPYTQAMAKHAIKAADPAFEPHNARRNVINERLGAAHVPTVSVAPGIAPEAGATLKSGRILPPTVNRSSSFEFQSGAAEYN